MQKNLRLSVLDQTPIRNNSDAPAALQESIRLARLADRLGYTRYWLSEHHNTTTLAGAAPEILIARLAAETKSIRLGSGGIMLPKPFHVESGGEFQVAGSPVSRQDRPGTGTAPGGDRLTAPVAESNQYL